MELAFHGKGLGASTILLCYQVLFLALTRGHTFFLENFLLLITDPVVMLWSPRPGAPLLFCHLVGLLAVLLGVIGAPKHLALHYDQASCYLSVEGIINREKPSPKRP